MIPKGWKLKTFSDIVDIIGGGTPKTTMEAYWEGEIPWLSVVDFNNEFRTVNETEKSITEMGLNNSSTKILKKGELIISARGTVGAIAQLGRDMAFNQSCYGLKAIKTMTDNDFIYYLLKYSLNILKQTTHGSTFDTITKNTFDLLKVPLPPMKEQIKIASILSVFDDKIELNHRMNQTLEAIGQAIFRHWFVHFEFPNSEGQPYKSSGGEMVDSELGEIPKGWKVIDNIAEKCDLINYGYTQSASQEKLGPKFLRVMDINKGDWINWETVPYCEIDKKQYSKYRLEKGDIVIARMADPGKVAIFESEIDTVFASYLIRIRLLDPKNSYYFYYLMKSPYYQYYIVGASSGTVQSNLNAKGLTRGLPIVIPDKNTINTFNETVGILRKKLNENIKENQNIIQIRDSLLPKLMSGKIRVNTTEEATVK